MAGFDITERVVFDLSHPIATAYRPSDAAWDCSIGGLPFNFALSKDRVYQRQTAQFKTTRVDQQRDASEFSLSPDLWVRSVSSLHYGAGQRAVEPLEVTDAIARFRFYRSSNVNVWNPGEISLNKGISQWRADSASAQFVVGVGNGEVVYSADASLRRISNTGSPTTISYGGVGAIQSLTSSGSSWYAMVAGDGVYSGFNPFGSGTKIWNFSGSGLVRWVKDRLVFAGGNGSLYELTGTGPTMPTPLFTHLSGSAYNWTDIADGPSSVYFSGYAGEMSTIYRSGLTISGGSVSIAAPAVVAEMPRGEIVKCMYSYLGQYLAIGTSAGLRVAQMNTDGSLTMGPLIFTCSGGVLSVTGKDRFLYATGGADTTANDGSTGAGIYRVDLSVEVDTLRFAYAQECVVSGTAVAPASVVVSGNQVVYTVPGVGLYAQAYIGTYATEGWLEYGRINFSTNENKTWQNLILRANVPINASIEVHASSSGTGNPSTWPIVGTMGAGETEDTYSLSLPAPSGTREMYVAVRLLGNGSVTPTLYGMSVRALPAPYRTREVLLPLLCFDKEKDRNGVLRGYDGGAFARLSALEDAEASGSILTFQDYTTGERRDCVVERVTWNRSVPPSKEKTNAGGTLDVILRLL